MKCKRTKPQRATCLLAILVSIFVIAGQAKELSEDHRSLYETDDDDSCFEQEACRMALGGFLVLFTPVVIFWNEHAHAHLTKLYNAAQRRVKDLSSAYNPKNDLDGKFVCVSETIQGSTKISDEIFPSIQVTDALLSVREIEIYQFVQVKEESGAKLEQRWCKIPQPDPPKFRDTKNPIGNWMHLAGDRLVDTGRTINGDPIKFGDNLKVHAAPNPMVGAFSIPPALMNEAFLGRRYVHRLHELERLKDFQGKWTTVHGPLLDNLEIDSTDCEKGSPLIVTPYGPYDHRYKLKREGEYVYDGDPNAIGTIRMKWRYVQPQPVTIVAEAVAPGRPCAGSYAMKAYNLETDPNFWKNHANMILSEVCDGEEDEFCHLLQDKSSLAFVNGDDWTLTPFAVKSQQWLPPYNEKLLGRLWMIAPGLLTSRQLFGKAHFANSKCLWLVRGCSYVLLLGGWMLLFTTPIEYIFGRGLLSSLFGFAFAVAAVILSTGCWAIVTALACFTARPVRSVVVLALVWIALLYLHSAGYALGNLGEEDTVVVPG